MIIDDYLNYTDEYKKKYGDNTLILMQVGSFFELYSIVDNCPFLYKIADICNIQISRKNKTIMEVSKNNPLMAGFPLYVVNKFVQLLLQNNYTIVMIEQISQPPNPERKITEILSPSTNMNITTRKSNFIMVFYFEVINEILVVGISGVDLTTGHSFIYENGASKLDPQYTLDECYRLLTSYNPSEILILGDDDINENQRKQVENVISLNTSIIHKKWNNYEFFKHMKKLEYQIKILEKAFNNNSMLSIIEYLNLERFTNGRISYCCLLQFAYEHNTDIIKGLNIPEIINNNKKLTLEYNSILQLNIISTNQDDKPLLDILNRCSTAFGSRGFKERLLMPINDIQELNKRYEKIEELIKDSKYKLIIKNLNNINDLERIKRKIYLKKYNPCEWGIFINSLEYAIEAFKIIEDNEMIKKIEEINDDIKILNIDECSKYNLNEIKTNIFKKGYYKNIDDLNDIYENKIKNLNKIVDNINNILNDSNICKLDYSDREGYFISITKKRFEMVSSKNKTLMNKFEKKANANNNTYKLFSKEMMETTAIIENTQNEIQEISKKEYLKFLEIFIDKNKNNLDLIITSLIDLDITTCNARNAIDFCYYKPIITNDNNDTSYLNAENVRHPIIERISNETEYIGNDISLYQNGILLYGINASGKSSFMKAIGLAVIMAQSGMYVPASVFNYYPYNNISTRICGNDNIYKGMSSFVVEMTELRNILQRANESSLIIGDEICCGTEAISGISIVSSAIEELVNKKSSFIFTSHLHELTNISLIKNRCNEEKPKLKIYHMHIIIDENNKIIYERKLKEGQGSSVYGIDVCKSLNMPNSFMKNAELIRKELEGLTNTIVDTKTSKYNSLVYLDICEVCKKNKGTEVHHINYQINADENGNFSNFNKNNKHNLVCICEECHKKEHGGEIGIIGYKQTSEGVKLEIDKKARIFKLIKRGKEGWLYRKKISDKYTGINEEELIKFYNKQMKTSIKEITIEMENLFFDPSL